MYVYPVNNTLSNVCVHCQCIRFRQSWSLIHGRRRFRTHAINECINAIQGVSVICIECVLSV